MKADNTDQKLTQLYRHAAREKSPPWLDAQILAVATRHARIRRVHRRVRVLAIAAVVAGLAIAIPHWRAVNRDQVTSNASSSIDPHSALADALRNLPVVQVAQNDPSRLASCLQRRDLCSNEPAGSK